MGATAIISQIITHARDWHARAENLEANVITTGIVIIKRSLRSLQLYNYSSSTSRDSKKSDTASV